MKNIKSIIVAVVFVIFTTSCGSKGVAEKLEESNYYIPKGSAGKISFYKESSTEKGVGEYALIPVSMGDTVLNLKFDLTWSEAVVDKIIYANLYPDEDIMVRLVKDESCDCYKMF